MFLLFGGNAILTAIYGIFVGSRPPSGAFLVVFWLSFWLSLGAIWGHVGLLLAPFGVMLDLLGPFGVKLWYVGAFWGHVGHMLAPFGLMLGVCWRLLGSCWGFWIHVGLCWAFLGHVGRVEPKMEPKM